MKVSNLKKLLNSLVKVVLEEAEANPEFGRKLEDAITSCIEKDPVSTQTVIKNSKEDKGKILDPLKILETDGEESLRDQLNSKQVTLSSLKAIAKTYGIKNIAKKKKNVLAEDIINYCKANVALPKEEVSVASNPSPMPQKEANVDSNPSPISQEEDQEVLDPVKIYFQEGPDSLRAKLEGLDLDSLHAIIKTHRLDSSRIMAKSNSNQKLKDFILSRAKDRATQGSAFLNYQG